MSLGFRTESTLTLQESEPITVASNEALLSLQSAVSRRALELESGQNTGKRRRRQLSRGRVNSGNSTTHEADEDGNEDGSGGHGARKSKKLGRTLGGCHDTPNSGVRERSRRDRSSKHNFRGDLDSSRSAVRRRAEERRMEALRRKAKLYEQLAAGGASRSTEGDIGEGEFLVDFAFKPPNQRAADRGIESSSSSSSNNNNNNNNSHVSVAEGGVADGHRYGVQARTSHQSAAGRWQWGNGEEQQQQRPSTQRASSTDRQTIRRGDASQVTGSRHTLNGHVKQRYEFGLSEREKAALGAAKDEVEMVSRMQQEHKHRAQSRREERRQALLRQLGD